MLFFALEACLQNTNTERSVKKPQLASMLIGFPSRLVHDVISYYGLPTVLDREN